jgi:helicase
VLDAAAQFAPQSSPEQARRSGLLSALAFASSGNFASSAVVAARSFPVLRAKSECEALLLLAAAPTLLDRFDPGAAGLKWARAGKYLAALRAFLERGDDASLAALRGAWKQAVAQIEAEPLERALAGLAVEHVAVLSTARALRGGFLDSSGALDRILNDGLRLLLPPQREALEQKRLHELRANAIVALPPGTGKTLLGEACALQALEGGGWACFLVPFVALGRQVAAALERHAPRGVRVCKLLGGEGAFDFRAGDAIVVATPERLDALLRTSPEAAARLKAVVCDEAHGVGDGARGVRLEGLLARLKMQRERTPSGPRLVLLSASVRRPRALQEWVGATDEAVVNTKWGATARRIAIWNLHGALEWHTGEENPPRQTLVAATNDTSLNAPASSDSSTRLAQAARTEEPGQAQVLAPGEVAWPSEFGRSFLEPPQRGLRPMDNWAAVQKGEEAVRANIARLVGHLHENFGGAILGVCATKKNARLLAVALAASAPPKPTGPHTQRAIELIEKSYGFLKPLAGVLERGVAWHHAGLPNAVREAIEAAIKDGEIAVVAATTTLAEGVDFPFRWTILVDWIGWGECGQAPLSRWLLRNIVGRCGRAGAWTEGDTIVYDNPLGPRALTDSPQRRRWIEHLCLAPGPAEARSALEGEQVLAGHASAPWLAPALETQFLAALGEQDFASVEDAVERFAGALYAWHRGADARPMLRAALSEWVAGEEPLIEQSASGGLRLSPVGAAFRASGLSPATARRLLQVLREGVGDWGCGPVAVGALLAVELGGAPEQGHEGWRKVTRRERNRFPLKRDGVAPVLEAWLRGESAEDIFAALDSTRNSTRSPRFGDWIDGGGMDQNGTLSDWYGDLDRWAEWLRAVPETFLPFALRAAEQLAPLLETGANSQSRPRRPWADWARFFEAGMNSELALGWKEAGAPGTRRALCALAAEMNGNAHPSPRALSLALSRAEKALGGAHSPDGRSLQAFAHWRGLADHEAPSLLAA